jgi:hypothetical protein
VGNAEISASRIIISGSLALSKHTDLSKLVIIITILIYSTDPGYTKNYMFFLFYLFTVFFSFSL